MATTRPVPRVMVDANVLIAGVAWPRWPYEVMRHAIQGGFQLLLSPYVIGQAQRRIASRFPGYIAAFNIVLDSSGYELVSDPPKKQLLENQNLCRGPTDVPIALAAINADADCLVSEDKDLTTKDETTTELRKRLAVFLSGTFLRELMGRSSEELERVRGRDWEDLEEAEGP